MTDKLRYDGKVVLVTGAGNGLGRAYALEFAERGASVIVNDLGVDSAGSGSARRPADKVVDEIKSKGGKAVANYDSVENGEKVVKSALDAFGRIDVVINNAGILRDKSFARISDDDWDIVQRVHLRGSFKVTRAAWPHMRKQNYGRIIMISSSSGLYGNFGQANYSAAKLGLVGLSNTLALEGAKNNITCNTVAPVAASRLTAMVMPEDVLKVIKPEYVSPLLVYMCHKSCTETGGIYEVGAGFVGKVRWQRTQGALLRQKDKPITPEIVRDNWNKITDFTDGTYPTRNNESTMGIIQMGKRAEEQMQRDSSTDDGGSIAKGSKTHPLKFSFTERDAMLYALGVGVSTTQPDHLKFLFEMSDDFSVIPTFGVIPAFGSIIESKFTKIAGVEIDPTKILHGEQYLELYKPFPRSGTLTSQATVVDILDKKSGAILLYNVETFDEKNEKVCFNQFCTFVVGAGNFGGNSTSQAMYMLAKIPMRAPDNVMEEKVAIDQAAIYRLSGDRNPLHIDPSFAAMGGFDTPILHGLCSFGFSVRHIMTKYANNDMTKFKAVKVRFAKPVIPGQTLRTEMWKEGNRIFFQTKIVENGNVCITGAYVDLVGSVSTVQPAQSEVQLKSTVLFQQMASQVKSQPDIVSKVNAVFQWNITKNGEIATTWIVNLKESPGNIYEGSLESGKADCTLTVSDDNFMQMFSGKLDAQKAFMTGKLKLSGNIMLAQKLGTLFSLNSKL